MKHLGFFAFLLGIVPLGFSTMAIIIAGLVITAIFFHAISRKHMLLARNQKSVQYVWNYLILVQQQQQKKVRTIWAQQKKALPKWDQMKPLCTWAREDEMGYLNSLEREFIS